MAKIKSVKSNTEVYAEIIADIASRAAAEIEGAELLGKNPDKLRIIKAWAHNEWVKNNCKWKAAQEYCQMRGLKFKILTEKTIKQLH